MKNFYKILASMLLLLQFTGLYAQELKFTDLNRGEKKPKMPMSGWKSYVSKDGTLYKAGDIIKIGFPSSNNIFAFIKKPGTGDYYPKSYTGKEVQIKYFMASGFKNEGFNAVVVCKGALLDMFNIEIENAIQSGEIKSFGMTSDEALSELKKAKDKLDLGIITQAKYDSLKVEYSKYIK